MLSHENRLKYLKLILSDNIINVCFIDTRKKGAKGTIENLIEMLKLLLKFKLEKEKISDILPILGL